MNVLRDASSLRLGPMRAPWRLVAGIAAVAAVAGGIAFWQLHGGGTARQLRPTATVARGDVIVSVGGVGRIVEAQAAQQIAIPSAAPGGAAASASPGATSAASAPAGAVFARASGRIAKLLVIPGQKVTRGEALAILDDGGSSAAALEQARNDLSTAMLELRQKRTSDPLKGVSPTAAELAAGNQAVTSAQARLERLLHGPRPADVSAAKLEVSRAEADLVTAQGGTRAARARAIAIAKENVQLAQNRLDRLLAPPDPADVSLAQAEVRKAEADLADLQRRGPDQPPASPEAIAAAKAFLDASQLRLAKLLGPPNPIDVTATRLELDRATGELRTLQAGPGPAALAAARQAVTAARARLAQLVGPPLQTDVIAARLDVARAQADLSVLALRGAPGSPTDVELAQLRVSAARARVAVARFAERQLTVHAPAGGTVTGVLTVAGAPVDATTPIVTVADLGRLAVAVDLSEFDAARVVKGLAAEVSVDALGGKTFSGKVQFVGLSGVDNGGVVTFPVKVSLEGAADLKPGMNVSVRIVVAERRNVVRVPLDAVSEDQDGRPIVTVVDAAGTTTRQRVKLGLANNKDVEIVSGLRAGQHVVRSGGRGG